MRAHERACAIALAAAAWVRRARRFVLAEGLWSARLCQPYNVKARRRVFRTSRSGSRRAARAGRSSRRVRRQPRRCAMTGLLSWPCNTCRRRAAGFVCTFSRAPVSLIGCKATPTGCGVSFESTQARSFALTWKVSALGGGREISPLAIASKVPLRLNSDATSSDFWPSSGIKASR